ncbi:MAG: FAD-dependent oxidoreductase, partial [Firmicutes bacterium]|nr:FAD-dependent oxidoreductase [Bacillota bacterium]
MKLVVIGGVAGGASAAARVRRLDEKAEIIVFERGSDVSYSNCALPYYLGGVVEKPETLIMMTPAAFKRRHNIDVRVNSEVVKIKRDEKKVVVKDTLTGDTYEESYDKLVLSPGARPVMPKSIAGIDRENVFSIRNVDDVVRIKDYLISKDAKDVAVVGGGFIGIEAAENLKNAGFNVSIIEGLGQVLSPFDYDSVQYIHKELYDSGVALHLSSMVSAVTDAGVKAVKDGKEFEVKADAVIMAIGVAPENSLAKDCGLEIGKTGGIKVNERFQTADPDIYAVGDAVETFSRITGLPGRLALAGPAQKEARIAADNICGIDSKYKGFIGSSCLQVFGLNAASTGLNEKAAKDAGLKFDSAIVLPPDKVGIMPGSKYMFFKLIFEVPGGRILGA